MLVKPKSHGGLGFKDMRLFNQALLAHQAMHLLVYLNSLCARVAHQAMRLLVYPNSLCACEGLDKATRGRGVEWEPIKIP
jgi:hypothetical protein